MRKPACTSRVSDKFYSLKIFLTGVPAYRHLGFLFFTLFSISQSFVDYYTVKYTILFILLFIAEGTRFKLKNFLIIFRIYDKMDTKTRI